MIKPQKHLRKLSNTITTPSILKDDVRIRQNILGFTESSFLQWERAAAEEVHRKTP